MNNNRRRNFRHRSQKNSFRRRNGTVQNSSNSNFIANGNKGFSRNGSMNNIHSVEKAMQKFQQLAKEAQSNGGPVLVENYLQHADHYHRRLNELNEKNIKSSSIEKTNVSEKSNNDEDNAETKIQQSAN